MSSVVSRTVLVACLTACLLPADVSAQVSERPWRGLFGSGPASDHQVSAFGSVFFGYDNNRLQELGGLFGTRRPSEERLFSSGTLTGANMGLRYGGQVGPVSLNASAGLGIRYYPDRNETIVVPTQAAAAGTGFSFALSRRTSLNFSQGVAYHPYYTLMEVEPPVLGDPVPPPTTEEDFAIGQRPSLASGSSVSLEHRFTRLTTLSTFYNFNLRHFFRSVDRELYGNTYAHRIGARLSRRISRYASLRAGYAYNWLQYANREDPLPIHMIDAGVDYGRSLSLTRRTSFSFSTGTSAVVHDRESPPSQTVDDRSLRFLLTGSASLLHEFHRDWVGSLRYNRNVSFAEGFTEPFTRDSISAGIGGLLGRRISTQASAFYTWGYVGFGPGDNALESSGLSAGLSAALTRYLAAYASAFYYDYGFGADVALPELVSRDQRRYGARVGLSAWLPIWP